MRAAEAAQAQAKRERAAAAAEELRTRPARAIAEATDSLARMPWAWARQSDIDDARLWLSQPEKLDAMFADLLLTLVGRARANVSRAEIVMTLAHEPELAQARMPGVPEAALEACRLLSERDADRATEWNRSGWGKTTTLRGHILAGRDALDEAATSHALKLLRRHRRQLPPALADRVFGGAAALAA